MDFASRVRSFVSGHQLDGDDDEPPHAAFLGADDMELHRRTFSRTLETGDQSSLMVDNRNGSVIIRVHDRPQVLIDVVAELYADSSKDADLEAERVERGIVSDHGRVDIRTPELLRPSFLFFGRGPKVDYEIAVPRETSVKVDSRNGRVEVRGVKGPVEIGSRNGPVTVEDCAEAVTVESRNGRIVVSRCGNRVAVKGRNGPLSIERVAEEVEVRTTNGAVTISDAGSSVRAESTNGPVRYSGPVAGDIVMEASNGSVHVRVPADSRFELDAESRNGRVRSDLPVRDDTRGSGPRPKVRLRTINGGIRIEPL